MCDSDSISWLYANVLQEDILKYNITGADIRTGIQNMKEVYLPNPMSLSAAHLDVANYNDSAHRCAYLHKYAPFHTALVAEMIKRAVIVNPKVFGDMLGSGSLNICSLGGGPGSDVIGALSVLNAAFGFFQVSATVVDVMANWRQTFASVIQELRYGRYGNLGDCVSDQYFSWNYLESNLLGTMSSEVNKAISTANLLTMIKFVSASACKDTPLMIKKIFRSMRPGALVLYVDNAGGGFHQMVKKEAQECNLITVFGPLKHEHYSTNDFNVKRFGYTPCLETKVSVHIWRKPSTNQPLISNPTLPYQMEANWLPVNNINQTRVAPGRANPLVSYANVDSWDNTVNRHFQGVHPQNVNNREIFTPTPPPAYSFDDGMYVNTTEREYQDRSQNKRSRSRGRSPRRPGRNNYRGRSARSSGYRPAPEETSPEEEEEELNCCCVIS